MTPEYNNIAMGKTAAQQQISLPPEILTKIFDCLTLNEQFTSSRCTSHCWREAFASKCATLPELCITTRATGGESSTELASSLFFGPDLTTLNRKATFYIGPHCRLPPRAFIRHVRRLVLCQVSLQRTAILSMLQSKWTQLTELRLVGIGHRLGPDAWNDIFTAISHLPNCVHLSLSVNIDPRQSSNCSTVLDFARLSPITAQLRFFFLELDCRRDYFPKQWLHFADLFNRLDLAILQQWGVAFTEYHFALYQELLDCLKRRRQLCRTLCRFRGAGIGQQFLLSLLEHHLHLSTPPCAIHFLDITVDAGTIARCLGIISRLPQMQTLVLRDPATGEVAQLSALDTDPRATRLQLPTIKQVHSCCSAPLPPLLARRLFPNAHITMHHHQV